MQLPVLTPVVLRLTLKVYCTLLEALCNNWCFCSCPFAAVNSDRSERAESPLSFLLPGGLFEE